MFLIPRTAHTSGREGIFLSTAFFLCLMGWHKHKEWNIQWGWLSTSKHHASHATQISAHCQNCWLQAGLNKKPPPSFNLFLGWIMFVCIKHFKCLKVEHNQKASASAYVLSIKPNWLKSIYIKKKTPNAVLHFVDYIQILSTEMFPVMCALTFPFSQTHHSVETDSKVHVVIV